MVAKAARTAENRDPNLEFEAYRKSDLAAMTRKAWWHGGLFAGTAVAAAVGLATYLNDQPAPPKIDPQCIFQAVANGEDIKNLGKNFIAAKIVESHLTDCGIRLTTN